MVKFGTPKDVSKYLKVKESGSVYLLHQFGFEPIYRDNEYVYFKGTPELLDFLLKDVYLDKIREERDCLE